MYMAMFLRWWWWSVLIVPLWNWNRLAICSSPSSVRSNRTFMELKLKMVLLTLVIAMVLIVPLWNWNKYHKTFDVTSWDSSNRTFMELKYWWVLLVHLFLPVLIVPLWNWNEVLISWFSGCTSSNRTFMELK